MKGLLFLFTLLVFLSCSPKEEKLPYLGNAEVLGKDTVYPKISDFTFVDQEGKSISNRDFENSIYVADFIFLSCPSICPKMTKAMLQVYIANATNDRVKFISHTIDPVRDSIMQLKAYAKNLGVSAEKWHFVTGNQDSILNIAEHSYFSTAYPDSTAPGGFTHSGGLLLIDKNRFVRGVYDGTKQLETERLIRDIQTLLKEQF